MNLESLFYQYNPWWEEAFSIASVVEREALFTMLYPFMETPDVLILTGLRRVGKTTAIKCLIHYLIKTLNINPQCCLYISMDDYQLTGMSLMDVLDRYRQLMRLSVKQKIYLFFDEITYVKDFQRQLKNLYDKGNMKCVVSSSSTSVLKDESAYLTGRKRMIEINPLDFNEYLMFKKIHIHKADKSLLESYFVDYMKTGGMPEYVLREEREYLVNLIDDIIMKDIVAHYGIRHSSMMKEFFALLMERAGKQVSLNKLANILKISPDTAKRYLSMFEATYLIHLVPRDGKTNETLLSAKKVYATDVGMRNITVGFRDKGAIFENIVFMKIKNRHPRYVLTDGQEIDFLVDNTLIEVKYHREMEGKQLAAFNAYDAKNKIMINNYFDLEKICLPSDKKVSK